MVIDYDGIIIMDGYSGIPIFSKIDNIDETLFSGFITAIRKFSEELSLGALSNFSTDEKQIFLIAREKIVVAIVTAINTDFQSVYSFAFKIASQFEEKFNLDKINEVSLFDSFIENVKSIEQEDKIPFSVKVVEFVRKEFGTKISTCVPILGNDLNKYSIDIIVDNGEKSSGSIRDRTLRKRFKAFSGDVFFIKLVNGTAGKAEVSEFLDTMKYFGKKENSGIDDIFPYFPSKAIIIAREYSPTVFEKIKEYPKRKDRNFISGKHILHSTHLKMSPDTSKCFIELWKWNEDKYPNKIQI